MKPNIMAAGRMALVLCVLAVIGIGTVSAAGTAHTGNLTALHGHIGYHVAANSSHQHTGAGFNLTSGAAGNATHVKRAHGFAPNATTQQERLQVFATALQKKGVDVSALETAIQNNDTAAEKTWLATYFEAHKGPFNNTTRQQWHPWNATASKSA